jgi:hypothetical protein
MASNFRRVPTGFVLPIAVEPKRFKRINDPELALEVAARREKNNLSAVRSGLPAVGSKLVNRYGLEFEVESHVHVPTANSVQRWREGSQSDADLFPSIIPQNLSQKLTNFVAAVDRCTTKTLLVLDTMPHARRDAGVPDGHWVDTIGNGGANLLFIDAAQIHETHFAHEIGHLWVQYVDQAEDERVMEDVSDVGRLHQLSFVQSFVTDLRVNQLIAEKGFDVSVIIEDQAASIASLGRAIEAGYRPENPREGVFMALALAAQILEEQETGPSALAKLDDTLEKVTRLYPELAGLATGLAGVVTRHGYDGKDQIRASIDDCLILAFDYSGDGIDLERDLVIPAVPEPDFDKYPQWIEGASPQMKCEVGRIVAREDIPDGSQWSVTQGPLNANLVSFELPDGTIKGPWALEHSQAFHAHVDRIQQVNKMSIQNLERQIQNRPTQGIPDFPGQPRRFYMAGMAGFLTRVREAEWLGGEQPYAYAMNNPVTYTDPSGNKPCFNIDKDCAKFGPPFVGFPTAAESACNKIVECWRNENCNKELQACFAKIGCWSDLLTDMIKKCDGTHCVDVWCCKSGCCGCEKDGSNFALTKKGTFYYNCGINLCDSFGSLPSSSQIAVFLHEISHCSGTADITGELNEKCVAQDVETCLAKVLKANRL